jgi:AcrR family transcriptional regulator
MVATTTTLPRRSVAGGPKFDHILNCATHVFYEKGYEGASIRDIARQGRISLAGLYYYVGSKEELLYLIQKRCFTTLLARLQEQLDSAGPDPESRLRILIHNHIRYFLQNREAMKVLSHEADTLKAPFADEVIDLKRSYYRLCRGILEDLKRERKLRRLNPRLAMLSLFGMMNWIYTWYKPRKDPDAEALAEQMAELFLGGIQATRKVSSRTRRLRNGRDRSSAS